MIATPKHGGDAESPSRKRLAAGFIITVSSFMALCSKHTKKIKNKVSTGNSAGYHHRRGGGAKKLFTNVSNKAMTLVHRKHHNKKKGFNDSSLEEDDEEYGVWQREILMGDKCEPLDFSGVIYYDGHGKQLHELPLRSPRAASPLPSYFMKNTSN
ncbi:hypothetical protein ACFE04_006505 [Oxalis oulophora]